MAGRRRRRTRRRMEEEQEEQEDNDEGCVCYRSSETFNSVGAEGNI